MALLMIHPAAAFLTNLASLLIENETMNWRKQI